MKNPQVTVVTIMFGNRWKFLSQVVEACMRDPFVSKMVIVDNGSQNKEQILEGVKIYGDKVIILREEKNLGSAGGFARGLEYARGTECDFVFLLDDDSVPESGAIGELIELRKLFPNKKIVLSGNRLNVPGNSNFFYQPILKNTQPKGTFFEVFSLDKIHNFLNLALLHSRKMSKCDVFVPIVPNESWVYGGALIPIEAVREAPLPDKNLFLYGDDIEYSWGIKKLGYSSYVCASPRIHDVDLTFGGSHIFGMFDPNTTQLFKIYFRVRNMVLLSKRHTKQSKPILFLNILAWTAGLLILGLLRYGPTITFWKRAFLIIEAIRGGYDDTRPIPEEAKLP